jgi:predicted RNA binding protein YcfA (HicA-like mRNA interferase family)
MPRLRVLSGAEVLRILAQFGFHTVSQRGSHIKLRRVAPLGEHQTLTIPNHRELDRGTLSAIYKQALRYIPAEKLAPHFFGE